MYLNAFKCIEYILKVFECIFLSACIKSCMSMNKFCLQEVLSILCVMGSSQSGAHETLS